MSMSLLNPSTEQPRESRPALALIVVGLLSFVLSAGLGLLLLPAPSVHDEFSYLLAADTFAHGRLANPPHPMHEHFQTMHVLQEPTYASKYPPGQGLALAAGILLANEPILGVWLSLAAACAAVTWMLQAYLPRPWPLLGGLLLTLHPQVLTWGQTFWGGALPMAGGALVWGALRRLLDAQAPTRNASLLALGLALLANTRPYEGLLIATPALLLLAFRLRPPRADSPIRRFAGSLLPLIALLLLTAAAMGYYNWRVTGRPWLLPYTLHDQTYNRTPHFVWQDLRPPKTFSSPELNQFHNLEQPQDWLRQQTWRGWAETAGQKLQILRRGAFQPLILGLCLLMLPGLLAQDPWMRWLGGTLLLLVAGLLALTWIIGVHYAAPGAGLLAGLLTGCLRRLDGVSWGRRRVGRGMVAVLLVMTLLASVQTVREKYRARGGSWGAWRGEVLGALEAEPGQHLVLVRYLPGHLTHAEWVYDGASPDESKIVWARDLGDQKNQALLTYYKDRQLWRLVADQHKASLLPYAR